MTPAGWRERFEFRQRSGTWTRCFGQPGRPQRNPTLGAFVDTNILVRHLTGDPKDMARRATSYLASAQELLLADLIVAETVDVLESFYEVPRDQVAEAIRALIGFDPTAPRADLLLGHRVIGHLTALERRA